MFKTKNHIQNARHIVLMWFILFALSPCVVKDILFNMANTEYAKPLNKTKSVVPTNSCQYYPNNKQQSSIVKPSNTNKVAELFSIVRNSSFAIHSIHTNSNYSKNYSGNSPPKYILYKCLKLDVAHYFTRFTSHFYV